MTAQPNPATTRDRYLAVAALALPAIGEMLLQMGLWAVDTAMVGRLGAVPLSGVSMGGQLYWVVSFAVAALGTGAFALVARQAGAEDRRGARETTATTMSLALLAGLGLSGRGMGRAGGLGGHGLPARCLAAGAPGEGAADAGTGVFRVDRHIAAGRAT